MFQKRKGVGFLTGVTLIHCFLSVSKVGVFELQAKDWRTQAAPDISATQLAQWMGVLKRQGVTSFGYYPDNFLENSPDLKTIRPALSNQWNP